MLHVAIRLICYCLQQLVTTINFNKIFKGERFTGLATIAITRMREIFEFLYCVANCTVL